MNILLSQYAAIAVIGLDPLDLKVLPVLFHCILQLQTGKEGQQSCQCSKAADDQRGEIGHKTGLNKGYQNRNEECGCQDQQHSRNDTKEGLGIVGLMQLQDRLQNPYAVSNSVQLGFAA